MPLSLSIISDKYLPASPDGSVVWESMNDVLINFIQSHLARWSITDCKANKCCIAVTIKIEKTNNSLPFATRNKAAVINLK